MASIITTDGFQLERFEDKKANRELVWKENFGEDLDVSDETFAGILIDIDTKEESENDELALDIYNSLNPDTASGTSLDFLCSLSDVKRLSALPTIVNCLCRGDEDTLIVADKKVSKSAGNYIFSLQSDITLSASACTEVFITLKSMEALTDYTVTVTQGGVSVVYTYTSGASPTSSSILSGIAGVINASSSFEISSESINSQLWIYADNLIDINYGYEATTGTLLEIIKVGVNGVFSADITGPTVINAEEINTINTPASGWDSVINLNSGITGRYIESDDLLRARRKESAQNTSCSTAPGIKKALLQNVLGTTTVIVLSNRTLAPNDEGEPKTFQAVVVGGEEQDIADEIWQAQPGGILSDGSISTVVIDSEGEEQIIKWSRPETVYIWVNYQYSIDSTASADVGTLINNNIVSLASIDFQIGDDILYQKLYEAIMDIQGVIKVPLLELAYQTVLTPVPDPVDYASDNITITKTQQSEFSTSRIVGAVV